MDETKDTFSYFNKVTNIQILLFFTSQNLYIFFITYIIIEPFNDFILSELKCFYKSIYIIPDFFKLFQRVDLIISVQDFICLGE